MWSESFGDSNVQYANAIETMTDNAIVVGNFSGTLSGATASEPKSLGGFDVFVMRFDPTGNPSWAKGFGGTGDQFAAAVSTVGTSSIIFSGSFRETLDFGNGNTLSTMDTLDLNAYHAILNGSGAYQNAKQFGDAASNQTATRIASTSANIFITGSFNGDVDFSSPCTALTMGSDEIFVAKLNMNGSCQWATVLKTSAVPSINGIVLDSAGDAIITGGFTGTLSCPGQPDVGSASADKSDFFVAKLSGSTGNCNWIERFGDEDVQIATAITVDNTNNIIVTGNYSGTLGFSLGANTPKASMSSNIFVAKFNSAGTPAWAVSFPSQSVQNAKAISIDSNGNPIITGSFQGTFNLPGLPPVCSPSSGSNVFLLKLDGSDGSPIWAKSFGDDQNQEGTGVAVDSNNNIWLTGNFDGSIDFGGNILTSKGGNDIFIAKFAP